MESVLCTAAARGISLIGCSSGASTSASSRNVSSSSSYGEHWRFREDVLGVQLPRRGSRHQKQQTRAIADGPGSIPIRVTKVKETKAVVMIDPIEAKRLASIEMEAFRAKQKLKKQRRIEAINGGFAVLGLTTGLILEGYTGKGILDQIAGYLDGLANFLSQASAPLTPSQEVLQEITSQISSTQEVLQNVINSP
ncbi:hypothetical protein R1sor_012337 [Riccia sorocarpa]|uniref:Uncharacterized protein n=1 Tax=Riccia sorocarpa TaxID=122646 RepID=A0ABD3I7M7_9MARC